MYRDEKQFSLEAQTKAIGQ